MCSRQILLGLGGILACVLGPVSAQPTAGNCEVKVLDGASREIKTYSPGSQPSEFPVAGVRGWVKCRMSQLKTVKVQGHNGVRMDVSCLGNAGQAMNASAVGVAHPQYPGSFLDVTTIELLGAPVTFAEDDNVKASGSKEITISCEAVR